MTRLRGPTLFVFLLNTAYLAASASPSLVYFTNVVLHIGLGIALAVAYAPELRGRVPRWAAAAAFVLLGGVLTGGAIVVVGAYGNHRWLLPLHIALSVAGGVPLLAGAVV